MRADRSDMPERRRRLTRAAGLLAAALLLAGGLVHALPQARPENGLASFDAAWQIIADTHFDPAFNGVDWEAVREELRPRAAAATSMDDVRAVIREMLSRLGQSHFALWPGEALGALASGDRAEAPGGGGEPGFETMLVGTDFVVSRVSGGGPAAAAGIEPGWIVRRVGDTDVAAGLTTLLDEPDIDEHKARVEAQRGMTRLLSGRPGADLSLELLDATDSPVEVGVRLRRPAGELTKFGNLPPLIAELDAELLHPDMGVGVGLIRFNLWLPVLARRFDEAIDTMRVADGIIIDLRGNPGGLGGMVMGIGGHFVDENVSLGAMRTRAGELRFVANPRRVDSRARAVSPYAGPLAILMDSSSASTSEVFAGGLQAIGRARVFGQRSMGAVLPSLMDELPDGDVLQHAFADFVVAGSGVRLEGRGVIPDEEVSVTRADLLAGRDPVRDAAVEWIVRQSGAPRDLGSERRERGRDER